jgi:hypothetical protein
MAKTYKMGLLPGDGTGPEVLRERSRHGTYKMGPEVARKSCAKA